MFLVISSLLVISCYKKNPEIFFSLKQTISQKYNLKKKIHRKNFLPTNFVSINFFFFCKKITFTKNLSHKHYFLTKTSKTVTNPVKKNLKNRIVKKKLRNKFLTKTKKI